MGIQNRDRVRAQKQTARLRPVELKVLLAIVAVAFGIGATGAWMSPKAGAVVVPTGVQAHAVQAVSAATEGQESGNPVLIGTVTRVLDGDTIVVQFDSGPIRVRFGSIDAPEKNQPAGPAASAALTRKLGQQQVALEVVTHVSDSARPESRAQRRYQADSERRLPHRPLRRRDVGTGVRLSGWHDTVILTVTNNTVTLPPCKPSTPVLC